MSTDNSASAPDTPAASLLFQAPAFQAPVFQEPTPAPREAAPVDDVPVKEKKTRSRRKADQAEAPADTELEAPAADASEEEPAPRRKRRTRKSQAEETAPEETAAETAGDSSSDEAESDDSSEEEGTSRRRRRRRSRSTSSDEGDPVDQVKALKGSTRLEAKKQRRREGRKEGRRRHGITESEFLARRESVNRTMVIRDHDGLDQIAILEDDLLVEHYVARRTQTSMVGNIYLGRVQNVLPSMEAAFVDIGRGRNAVLYAGEVNWDAVGLEGKPRRIESALKSGDTVLVQVTKDPIGHKGARLTSQITLAGRYLVLIPNGSMMGISRKLPDKERTRLKKILKQVVPAGSGVIVRTAAEGASEQQIRDDVARLTKQWADIDAKQSNTKNAPTLLRGEPELAVRVVRDIFNEDFSKLVIEGKGTYKTIKEYIEELSPELTDRVEQWVGTEDAFHAHRIDEQLAKGMDRKVWLPSGGTLIIDRTEAMTVIDVNTGKFIGAGGTLEETVTKNNLEAAEEIVRQLRLRDIGGIIIVDFVDMVLESNRDLVLRRLVECLGRDRTRHQVTEITSLGLVQMTRKRVGEGLVEAFSTPCEACEGRGFIVHSHPVESTGAADHTGSAPKSKRKKAAAEPRRIEDGAEHAKAVEALSVIAAASRKADDIHEGEVDAQPTAEAPTVAPSVDEGEKVAPKKRGRIKRTVVAPAAGPAQADTEQTEAPVQAEPKAESTGEKRPRRRRRAASADAIEPAMAGIPHPDQSSLGAAPLRPAAPALESAPKAPAIEAAPKAEAPKRPRRRAATAEAVEPEAAPAVKIELPTRLERRAEAPTLSTDAIELPDTSAKADDAPKRPRRRRVASTGVVDAG